MRATAQAKQQEVLSELIDARRQLLAAADALPPDKRDTIFLGTWSAADLIAHLAGWDDANLEAAHAVLSGRLPAFYAHHDRDWRSFNARLVAEYRRDDFAELLALVAETHRRLVEFLTAIPPDEFDRDTGVRFKGWRVTVARLLRAEASDERVHCSQLEEYSRQIQGSAPS